MMTLSNIKGGEGGPWELPEIYVGGKLLGGFNKVMEAHIKGEFVPCLGQLESYSFESLSLFLSFSYL